jgi:hypothetical protein
MDITAFDNLAYTNAKVIPKILLSFKDYPIILKDTDDDR